uniref:ATP synthase F0 subunit 6 n=1 Tax=Gastrothylax crumenifer TaxID=762070 RepID=A0A0K0L8H8_GASCU|nr:ATP synthase F0 subunit 6 [Gastrothylax crumenifer]AIU44445.1 ATP synthase F0 subunit 6 [Gastrothylax crumenifer]
MFVSRLGIIFNAVWGIIEGGWNDYFYRFVLFGMLFCFLLLRVPNIFGVNGFAVFLFVVIFPLFFALFLSRVIDGGVSEFCASLIPDGTPLWIAPFVCLSETLSYIVRPIVLMIRPFVNLTIGSMGGYVLGLLSLGTWWVFVFLFLLFFYEVFVACVHWFIVCSILSFSENH